LSLFSFNDTVKEANLITLGTALELTGAFDTSAIFWIDLAGKANMH
jgi:plasmid maintenance system antidote protein VapI